MPSTPIHTSYNCRNEDDRVRCLLSKHREVQWVRSCSFSAAWSKNNGERCRLAPLQEHDQLHEQCRTRFAELLTKSNTTFVLFVINNTWKMAQQRKQAHVVRRAFHSSWFSIPQQFSKSLISSRSSALEWHLRRSQGHEQTVAALPTTAAVQSRRNHRRQYQTCR